MGLGLFLRQRVFKLVSTSYSLESLSKALPVAGRALFLKASFNQSLIDSLNYLLEACHEAVPSSLFSKATQKINSLSVTSKLSGLLGVIHSNLFNAAEQNDLTKVCSTLERFSDDTLQHENLTYVNLSNVDDYYSPLVRHVFSQELKREVEYYSLPSEDFEKAKCSIQRGIQIIERSFPDFYAELQDLVSEILVVKARGLKQGSSSDLFGMVYKSSLFRGEKITDAVDFLIHEQSHLYVHALNKDDPILLNPAQMYYSPLREEDRPLMGIYHATFVLSRMQYVLGKALTINEIPDEEQEYCKELIGRYQHCFHEGFDTIMTNGHMTPLGSALIQSARTLLP